MAARPRTRGRHPDLGATSGSSVPLLQVMVAEPKEIAVIVRMIGGPGIEVNQAVDEDRGKSAIARLQRRIVRKANGANRHLLCPGRKKSVVDETDRCSCHDAIVDKQNVLAAHVKR